MCAIRNNGLQSFGLVISMASSLQKVKRKSGHIFYQTKMNGKVHYLGTDIAAAHRAFAKLISQHPGAIDRPTSVSELMEAWGTMFPDKQLKWSEAAAVGFGGSDRIDDVDPAWLKRFTAKLISDSYKPKTVHHYVGYARQVFAWAVAQGWMDKAPLPAKLPRTIWEPRDVAPADIGAAFAKLPPIAKPILTFILETGCRPSEAMRLKWSSVDLERGVCVLTDHKTAKATGLTRTIYLTEASKAVLKEIVRDEESDFVFLSRFKTPYTRHGLHSILFRAAEKAEVRVGLYALRHTRLQSALDQGLPIEEVAGLAGHSGLVTIRAYARVRDSRLKTAASRLTALLPAPKTPDTASPPADSQPKKQARRRKKKASRKKLAQ